MFDQILDLVKQHLGSNPQIASAIPAEQTDAVHQEVAKQITTGLATQVQSAGGAGGLLSMLENEISSGSNISKAIEGGLASSLGSKFGLPPSITGAISAVLPGLLQKFAQKANDPNDNSVTPESISKSLPGSIGGLFNKL